MPQNEDHHLPLEWARWDGLPLDPECKHDKNLKFTVYERDAVQYTIREGVLDMDYDEIPVQQCDEISIECEDCGAYANIDAKTHLPAFYQRYHNMILGEEVRGA